MTCFWDGILKSLNNNDFKFAFDINKKLKRKDFIKILKNKNKLTSNILWNNKKLKLKELKENFIAIKNYNINKIQNGHLCSSCDYFLLLICELFCVNIIHNYNNIKLKYKNIKFSRKTLNYYSNERHFWS